MSVPGGNDHIIGGNGDNGDDVLVGTFGSDTLNGGRGDDLLDGDLPPQEDNGSPVLDPNPNFDTCNGDQGNDMAFGCEAMTGIESVLGG